MKKTTLAVATLSLGITASSLATTISSITTPTQEKSAPTYAKKNIVFDCHDCTDFSGVWIGTCEPTPGAACQEPEVDQLEILNGKDYIIVNGSYYAINGLNAETHHTIKRSENRVESYEWDELKRDIAFNAAYFEKEYTTMNSISHRTLVNHTFKLSPDKLSLTATGKIMEFSGASTEPHEETINCTYNRK